MVCIWNAKHFSSYNGAENSSIQIMTVKFKCTYPWSGLYTKGRLGLQENKVQLSSNQACKNLFCSQWLLTISQVFIDGGYLLSITVESTSGQQIMEKDLNSQVSDGSHFANKYFTNQQVLFLVHLSHLGQLQFISNNKIGWPENLKRYQATTSMSTVFFFSPFFFIMLLIATVFLQLRSPFN